MNRTSRIEVALPVEADDSLLLRGQDSLDLLHRISASEVRQLEPGRARHFLFTDDKGALVDAPLAWKEADGTLVLIASPGRGAALRDWIDRWIIVDDVEICPGTLPAFRLGEASLAGKVDPGSVRRDSAGTLAVPADRTGGPVGAAILVGPTDLPLVDADEWASLHFAAGRYHAGRGLAAGPIPLELGWKDLVSFDKGCYIGQEVIARMDSYDKLRRGLATARLETAVRTGTELRHDGKRCGIVLECAQAGKGVGAWIVVQRDLAAGSSIIAGKETAGTLLRAPAIGQ